MEMLIRVSVLLYLIYRFNIILTKIPASLCVDIDKLVLKYIWKGKGTKRQNKL